MKPYKGRKVSSGNLVQVYRNLHTGGYSIRCKRSKLVLAHADKLALDNPVFIVSQSGRERVLRDKVKNVHAYIEGVYCDNEFNLANLAAHLKAVIYNPYITKEFTVGEQLASEADIEKVYLTENGVYFYD